MSLELGRQVDRENPKRLQLNLGSTCYQHLTRLIELLRANGHEAYHVVKTVGEGQYIPPVFQPRTVTGLDGKPYTCTGVSHDALWCDGKQFDTLSAANEHNRPIYRKSTDPFWSFDPNDGAQFVATPVWNEVSPRDWRPWNPPLKMEPVIVNPPRPADPPPSKILPKGEAFMALKALNAFYAAPEGLQRPGGLVLPDHEGRSVADMEAIAQWFYQLVIEGIPLDAVFAQIRASEEWRSKHP